MQRIIIICSYCLLVPLFIVAENCNNNNMKPEAIINMIMLNYSRNQSPEPKPTPVSVEVTVQDIIDLSVLSNSFTADIWFSAIWHDPRLAFAHLDPCRTNLSFDDSFEKLLWSPNVCLVNTKVTVVHSSPKANVLLMLLPNGTIWLNYRVRVEAPCEFMLADFPLDVQTCQFVFESYSYNTATVTVDWMPIPISFITSEFSVSDYQLTGVKSFKHTEYYKAGEWYRLTIEFNFQRRYGFYILQFGNMSISLPPVSYVKAIDIFMFTCVAFIFASLLELAFIAYQDKKNILRSIRLNFTVHTLLKMACIYTDPDEFDLGGSERQELDFEKLNRLQEELKYKAIKEQNRAFQDFGSKIDRLSFILFPLRMAAHWTKSKVQVHCCYHSIPARVLQRI